MDYKHIMQLGLISHAECSKVDATLPSRIHPHQRVTVAFYGGRLKRKSVPSHSVKKYDQYSCGAEFQPERKYALTRS